MQPLICVEWSVQYWVSCAINKGGFFEIAFIVVVDTHLPRFEALAYVLPHFDAPTQVVIHVSSTFIFQTYLRVCWRSTIDLSLMNLPKHSSFKSVLKVYTLSKILLWIKPSYFSLENACYSWCMHQTGLFSSASIVPQSKFTDELWSSACVLPQSKSTEFYS